MIPGDFCLYPLCPVFHRKSLAAFPTSIWPHFAPAWQVQTKPLPQLCRSSLRAWNRSCKHRPCAYTESKRSIQSYGENALIDGKWQCFTQKCWSFLAERSGYGWITFLSWIYLLSHFFSSLHLQPPRKIKPDIKASECLKDKVWDALLTTFLMCCPCSELRMVHGLPAFILSSHHSARSITVKAWLAQCKVIHSCMKICRKTFPVLAWSPHQSVSHYSEFLNCWCLQSSVQIQNSRAASHQLYKDISFQMSRQSFQAYRCYTSEGELF